MSNIIVRFVSFDDFYLVDAFCDEQKLPRLDPQFSKVVIGFDLDTGKVVGIMVAQMVLHAEPIWIDEEHRGGRLWVRLVEEMDEYLTAMGAAGVYNQPTSPTAERLAEKMGYVKADYPLWVKHYTKEE